ncbi:predicted protein [Chaetoceros tenuissimus]|uniref:Uncharacterized protein n=1 Tax=Chaetoceros tenuissimus TaxID=426638 RepID=A0AAD3HA37_9STRA|nr:predicted protein [Chaetoceros tenuissimus]
MSNETLSKSKKKRLKRLAAQKRREEEANLLLTTPYIPEDSLNPLDKLREKLTTQDGYELSLVDCAMDEMWNLGLEYGEYSEVKIFLENNVHELLVKLELKQQQAQQKQVKEEPKRVTFVQEPVVEPIVEKKEEKQPQGMMKNQIQKEEEVPVIVDEEVPDEATPAILVDVEEEEIKDSFVHVTAEPEVVQEVTPLSVPVPAPAPVAAEKVDEVVEQPTSLDLMTKLDIVANTDDLNDAIIALTEWINKAATPEEIQKFCNPQSKALATVITRCMTSSSNSTGQLLDLIGSILRNIHVPSTQLVTSVKALGSLWMQSKSITNQVQQDMKENMVQSVVSHSINRIHTMVQSYSRQGSSQVNVSKLKEEIQQMEMELQKMNKTDKNMLDLMMQRDACKSLTEKYDLLLNISGSDAVVTSPLRSSNKVTVESTLKELLSTDQLVNITNAKRNLEKFKLIQTSASSTTPERSSLLSQISLLEDRQLTIVSTIESLTLELNKMKMEQSLLEQDLNQKKVQLKELDGSLSNAQKEFNAQMDESKQWMELESSLQGFCNQIVEFDEIMQDVGFVSKQSKSGASGEGSVSLVQLLHASHKYFQSELETIEYLKARANAITTKIPTITREIAEFEMLGMSSTVADMKKNLKEMEQNAQDDLDLVQALTKEAEGTKDTFIDQLQGFLSSPAYDQSQQGEYAEVLKEIDTSLAKLDMSGDIKWSSVMIMYGCAFGSPVKTAEKKLNTSAQASVPAESSNPKPKKTGWNIAAAGGAAAKSLRDIQNEELTTM